jgi:hypothetical protein
MEGLGGLGDPEGQGCLEDRKDTRESEGLQGSGGLRVQEVSDSDNRLT